MWFWPKAGNYIKMDFSGYWSLKRLLGVGVFNDF